MTGSKELPIEIINNIFQYLPTKSLKECRMVCQLWHVYANRYFMKEIMFCNVKQVNEFLNCHSDLKSIVKKIEIDAKEDHSEELSRESVKQLMQSVINLQDLQVIDSFFPLSYLNSNVTLPANLTSISIDFCDFETIQDADEFLHILANHYSTTLQRFSLAIGYDLDESFHSWDMALFFGSFTNLTELDVTNVDGIRSLIDYIPIIEAVPSLKSFKFNCYADIDDDFTITPQLQQRLGEIEELKIYGTTCLPHTFSFIIKNFVGLKQISANVRGDILKNANHSDAFIKFLDFIYAKDKHNIALIADDKYYHDHLSKILSRTFTEIPKNSRYASRHLHMIVMYTPEPVQDIHHNFQLISNRDYYNRLQRRLNWRLGIKEDLVDDLFNNLMLPDVKNVNTFTFDITFAPHFRCFDLFFEVLSLLKEPKKVALMLSNDCNWHKYEPSSQFDHITHLEIQVKNRRKNEQRYENMLFPLDIFPNLKTLDLAGWCGIWYPEHYTYSVELPLLKLKSLSLNVTPIVNKGKDTSSKEFILEVKTNHLLHFYKVSTESLFAVQVEPQVIQTKSCLRLYVEIQNLQILHLCLFNDKKESIFLS